jgi:hypothetical protein
VLDKNETTFLNSFNSYDNMKENKINPWLEIFWDNSRPEAIEEIHRWWFNCKPCTKWKDSVITWINIMKWLKLYITAKSTWVKKDFDNYVWSKDKNWKCTDIPIKLFDDWPDAWRYCIKEFFTTSDFDIAIW